MTDERLNKIRAAMCECVNSCRPIGPYIDAKEVLYLINELEQLRKVVGLLGRGWDYWFISDSDAKANNLDIAALKERK